MASGSYAYSKKYNRDKNKGKAPAAQPPVEDGKSYSKMRQQPKYPEFTNTKPVHFTTPTLVELQFKVLFVFSPYWLR